MITKKYNFDFAMAKNTPHHLTCQNASKCVHFVGQACLADGKLRAAVCGMACTAILLSIGLLVSYMRLHAFLERFDSDSGVIR